MNKQACGKRNERGGKTNAPLPESNMRGRGKGTMPTEKAAGRPGESGNDAPGKREKANEESEDGQGEKMRTVFFAFFNLRL